MRLCIKCGDKFKPLVWNHTMCGSKTNKTGCSYEYHLKRIRKYNQGKGKHNHLKLIKDWMKEQMKEQRKRNTPYAIRQRKSKSKYARSPDGKKVSSEWRKRNINKVLEWNRNILS